jgi:hypothetical protein
MRGEINAFTQKRNTASVSPVGVNCGVEASDGSDTIMASEFVRLGSIIGDCNYILGS